MSTKADTTTRARLKPQGFPPPVGAILQPKCACGRSPGLSGECEDCQNKRLQRKLAVGSSHDPLELEADRIADQVVANSGSATVGKSPLRIQRLTGQSLAGSIEAPASVGQVLASTGRPLEPSVRQDMEQRFGYDFSSVRVHSGSDAERSARDVNAAAYTFEHNIVFARDAFAPDTNPGRKLLAHELTHVVQQSSARETRGHEKSGLHASNGSAACRPTISTGIQRKTPDDTLGIEPVKAGRRRPKFADAGAVAQAESTRKFILDSAINLLGPQFVAVQKQRDNEPTRPFRVDAPVATAMRALGLYNPRLDLDTAEGVGATTFLLSAFFSLVKNRYIPIADAQIGDSNECSHSVGTIYAIESSFGAGGREPIVLCPVYFSARAECQAFILMHEYFHRVGLVGHGEIALASSASRADEVRSRGYKPGYLVANPSALATFAWLLATSRDPSCSETSHTVEELPTSPKGPVA